MIIERISSTTSRSSRITAAIPRRPIPSVPSSTSAMSAHRDATSATLSFLVLTVAAALIHHLPSASAVLVHDDRDALLSFYTRTSPSSWAINWTIYSTACGNWEGVVCSADGTRVIGLHLPAVGLRGPIPSNSLSRLTALETLNLGSNRISGPFPPDFGNLTSLTELHLQLNGFSGPLPQDLSPWRNLKVLDLSFNGFNGSIPESMSNLTQLVSLNLANNFLSGTIPDIQLPSLNMLNLSNNILNGRIPVPLLKFPNSSFSGNRLDTSTPTLHSPLPLQPAQGSPRLGKKLSVHVMLGIVIGACALIFALLTLIMVFCLMKKKSDKLAAAPSGKPSKWDRSPAEKADVSKQVESSNRMVFFEGCTFAFDLEDLLRASAEVLGKGTFGTAYKAVMEDSTAVVVKRLKDVAAGKREFEQQMEVVGKVKHDNVVELRAYYYSKDEKLIVYDYYIQGSVYSLLHGEREERIPLDWITRLKIALGAARGIEHIHTVNGGKLVHGNIKSTNIFLNQHQYGCLSDMGMVSLMNPIVSPVSRTAGYRAPEVTDSRKASQMSDVYSFGVVLLELLTGKSPVQLIGGGDEYVHLVRWVQSVVREEWTAEVFDVALMRYPNIEEEMVEMLQIALTCVMKMPEQRPKISEVVKMIEDVRRFDTANRPSADARSEDSNVTTPPPPM